jgi:diadenosine tetraphosphatase ApaH/serine/threonine PP2A family protein phosphatase
LKGALKDSVEKNREMIVFSKFLATIKTDVPIDFNADDLRRKDINEEELRRLFDELEFRQLSNRVFGTGSAATGANSGGANLGRPNSGGANSGRPHRVAPTAQLSLFGEPATGGGAAAPKNNYSNLSTLKTVPHTYYLVDDEAKIADLIGKIEAQKFCAFDTETTGLDTLTAELVGMSFALQSGEAYFVPASAKREEAQKTADFFKGVLEELSPTEIAMMIRTQHRELITFLEKLPLYYEWENYLFVHAGVDLTKKDWHDTDTKDFMWIREPFHQGVNNTGKTIVFGHTITPSLYGDGKTTSLWRTEDNKIGIDGGGVYGGSIHGVVFDKEKMVEDIEISNTHGGWQPDF